MKKTIILALLALPVILVFNSCSVTAKLGSEQTEHAVGAVEPSSACFVQKTDGSIVGYQTLKLVNSIFNNAYLLADGKTRIYPKEILSYQTSEYFAITQKKLANGHKSFVSMDCLPGYARRIAKGQMNVYSKKYFNGTVAVDEYYIQWGEFGPIRAYKPAQLKELIKSNPEASRYFSTNMKQKPTGDLLLATASMVNNNNLVSKN